MKIIVNVIGVEVRLKQEILLDPTSPSLGDVVRALRDRIGDQVRRFVTADLTPVDCSAILVNGRNMLSLQGWQTEIRAGDELTFLVPAEGG
ncbi:MAG: MoaD/ThiS family protein [Syntrophales bacterium]